MLGSLVVIYPTPHEGGELVLRHKDREWKIGAKSLTALRSTSSLAYVAFYSDIDHEVLKVTSGRRVTVTYNLYLVNTASDASTVTSNPMCASNFQITLRNLLRDPTFLPDGGTLGFGLVHLYPVSSKVVLQEIVHFLKGEDAYVYKACRELQLKPSLKIIYDDTQTISSNYGIMMDEIVVDPEYNYENNSYRGTLVEKLGGIPVNIAEGASVEFSYWISDADYGGEFINWISPFSTRNELRDVGIAYGNEISMDTVYCSPCIIVRIGPARERT